MATRKKKAATAAAPPSPESNDPLGMVPDLMRQLQDMEKAYEVAVAEIEKVRHPATITVTYGAVAVTFPVNEGHRLLHRAQQEADKDEIVNGGQLMHTLITPSSIPRFTEKKPEPVLDAAALAGDRPAPQSNAALDKFEGEVADMVDDFPDMGLADMPEETDDLGFSDLTTADPVPPPVRIPEGQRLANILNAHAGQEVAPADPGRKTVRLTCEKCGGSDIDTKKGPYGDFYPCRQCRDDTNPDKNHIVTRKAYWLNHPQLRGKLDPHGHVLMYFKGKDGRPDLLGTKERCGFMKSLPDALPS